MWRYQGPGPDACRQTLATRGPAGRANTERKDRRSAPPITKTDLDLTFTHSIFFCLSICCSCTVFLYLSVSFFIYYIYLSLSSIFVSYCRHITLISMFSESIFLLSYYYMIVVFDRHQIMYFLIISESCLLLGSLCNLFCLRIIYPCVLYVA